MRSVCQIEGVWLHVKVEPNDPNGVLPLTPLELMTLRSKLEIDDDLMVMDDTHKDGATFDVVYIGFHSLEQMDGHVFDALSSIRQRVDKVLEEIRLNR